MANKALLVTIGAYPTKPLKGPPFDYVDWNGLVSGAPFNFTMLPALQEAAATKAAIMASVTTLLAGAANGDHLLLYFSGHGTRVDDDNGTHDGVVAYPAASGAPQISDVVFESEFEALVVGSGLRNTTAKLTIVLDCCHAAGIGSPFDIRLMKELDAARFISVDTTGANPIAAGTMSQLVEPHFLAATGKNSAAYEGDVNGRIRGLFSYAFANAVRAAPNNRITHSDAMAAAQAFINPRHADQDVDQFGPRKRAIFLA